MAGVSTMTSLDNLTLKSQLATINFKKVCGDTDNLTIAEILDEMTIVKARAADMKKQNVPAARYVPTGVGMDNKKHSLKSLRSAAASLRNDDHSVNRFHLSEPTWNNHQIPDSALTKVMPHSPT
jgi:hypothetical protein